MATATLKQADAVFDPLAAVEALTDPSAVELIATQLNDSTQNQNLAQGAPTVKNLTSALQDLIIETTAQGASFLELHIIDPYWMLLTRYGDNPAFFDVDDSGLWIPVDVNFPQGTDCWWRLASGTPTLDPTQANVFVFEDRIVTQLRDLGGPKHASNNQTRAEFIYSCVRQVPGIRFVCPALSQAAGSVAGDITQGQIASAQTIHGAGTAGTSATKPKAPSARRNPAKAPGIDPTAKRKGAYWTPHGWRYTKPINGMSPKVLDILNPPTNQPDGFGGGGPGSQVSGFTGGFGGF